ncbi:MAG TPA: hypothetical protein VNI78_10630, partial [Vicinamibacterales bacterium]|nr:hypothetical protein [Vicinamibacterales bacterium]
RLEPKHKQHIRVEFYGRMLPEIMPLARRYDVESMVQCFDPVPYAQSLNLQRGADVLLLLLWNDPRERGVFTGKLFEYLGARRPILATGLEDGVAAELIRTRQAGFVSNRPDEIAGMLAQWCDAKQRDGRLADVPAYACAGLSRVEQFRKLGGVLAEVAKDARSSVVPSSVLVVIPKLDIGGTEQHLLSVLPRLDRSGYQVEVFALAGGGG